MKSPKANKDGWTRHRGGKQPVHDDIRVEYRIRSGRICKAHAGDLDWDHNDHSTDIMAWKVIEDEKCAPIVSQEFTTERSEGDAEMPAAKHFDGPIQWRDRIREIDATAIALNEERAHLVAKLKAEGFALIQGDEPNIEVESAQQDIAQQDMSDPANWREGDLFEIIGEDSHHFDMAEVVRLKVLENDHSGDGHRYEHLDRSDYWWVRDCNVRFHSRPTT